ncbi:MAG: ABC transporter permease [Zetaproteobacteria bacterium]|nr:ABC transporter permease [Zetaproteobacteria bacterium]
MMNLNHYGAWTLFMRENRRFMKVKMQSLLAPALTSLMYLLVFRYAMGERTVPNFQVDYMSFLIPGLVMMTMLQNAFANSSSSMITAKVMKVHIYFLMAPLSAWEVVLAFLGAAVIRACVVGGLLLLMILPFVSIPLLHLGYIFFYGFCGSVLMGGLGLISGMWARKFDDMALINNFVIMPLTFLSGVFYSVEQLPKTWQAINDWNPFFYLIDGFRYGFIGMGDADPMMGMGFIALATVAMVVACWYLWRSGWKLKE